MTEVVEGNANMSRIAIRGMRRAAAARDMEKSIRATSSSKSYARRNSHNLIFLRQKPRWVWKIADVLLQKEEVFDLGIFAAHVKGLFAPRFADAHLGFSKTNDLWEMDKERLRWSCSDEIVTPEPPRQL